jgi:hypothetical protein
MENYLDWCPKFNNLTKLTLGEWCLHANFYALIVFLQNSPNLVKLTLKFVQVHAYLQTFFDLNVNDICLCHEGNTWILFSP